VIPGKTDQAAHRMNKGRAGGRPPNFDRESYRGRNVVERAFNKAKQWRAVATRYDKLASPTEPDSCSPASSSSSNY